MLEPGDILHYVVLLVAILSLLITVSNLRFIDSLRDSPDSLHSDYPRYLVSILVPARNEESGIEECLKGLSNQGYDPLEIIVLDDNSTDRTAEIIESFEGSDKRIRMIKGVESPVGWIGKQWACEQLYRKAAGDYLLFIDADTILAEGTVSAAVHESSVRGADLLTVIPQRIASCLAERLLFPFMDWIIFCWMPMPTAHKKKNPYLSASYGQFMLFTRQSYQTIGRHSAIRNNPLDDFNLGRITKKLGLKWVLFEGTRSVEVLAFAGNLDAFRSVSRSIFPVLNYSVSIFVLFSVVLLALGFVPIATLINEILYPPHQMDIMLVSLLSVVIVASSWFVACRKFKHSMLTVLYYPLSIAVMWLAGCHSVFSYVFHLTNWKSRKISKQKIRV